MVIVMESTCQAHRKNNKKPGTLSKELWSSIPDSLSAHLEKYLR
jgi:hypothetical protein